MSAVDLDAAVNALREGEVVALPTESSFGLAVDALSPAAVERLFVLKGRTRDKPPPLLIADEAMLHRVVRVVPPRARALMQRFWPGPLTLVLPPQPTLPSALVLDDGIGVRISPHAEAHKLCVRFGGPLTASSANLSGQPAAMTAQQVQVYFPDLPIVGQLAGGGLPSTVVRVAEDGDFLILREGAIARSQIILDR